CSTFSKHSILYITISDLHTKMTKKEKEKAFNLIDERNFKKCATLTSRFKLLKYFKDHQDLLKIFANYRASSKLDDLSLFYCFVVSLMHWGQESKLYVENHYVTVKLFGVLRGDSGKYMGFVFEMLYFNLKNAARPKHFKIGKTMRLFN
ncbi:unnamed protein product, partial [Didymodactylos carnosus]